jgi:hypothetical protein
MNLAEWQQFVLVELSHVFAGLLEYDRPGELAARLEGIARELRECFGDFPARNDQSDPEMAKIERAIRYRPGRE